MILAPVGSSWVIFGGKTHGSQGHLVRDDAVGPPFTAICGARQHPLATGQTRLGYLKRDGYAAPCHRCVAALPALAEPAPPAPAPAFNPPFLA